MQPKTLPSNEYWGRRSGKKMADGNRFTQQQWASGGSRSSKQLDTKLINVNPRFLRTKRG